MTAAPPARPSALTVAAAPDEDGIIDAMGGRRAACTAAQLVNRLAPTAVVYEAVWRKRSLGLLSGRPFPIDEELAELSAATAPGPDLLAVDVACSEGLYGRHLAHAGAEVHLLDHSRPFLRKALRRCREEGVADRVVAVRALAQHLPYADGTVDIVVMGGSLNEIGDQRAALAEMARVLRPGGRLFLLSLVAAGRAGGQGLGTRLGQLLARPSGITFPTQAQTVAMLGPTMQLVGERLDGVVLRLSAVKRPTRTTAAPR
ncbi:MAG: class I SAM-dependent methyltransferase [Acidimicrobiales bacterium]